VERLREAIIVAIVVEHADTLNRRSVGNRSPPLTTHPAERDLADGEGVAVALPAKSTDWAVSRVIQ
jgi:hypothetical protein